MKTRKVCTIIMVLMAVVLIVGAVVWANTPERKAFRFVDQHSTELSEILDNEQPIPVTLSGKHYNNWDAEHPMDEFILHTWGNTYYGCYYSPDDIPLAFQNYRLGCFLKQERKTKDWISSFRGSRIKEKKLDYIRRAYVKYHFSESESKRSR